MVIRLAPRKGILIFTVYLMDCFFLQYYKESLYPERAIVQEKLFGILNGTLLNVVIFHEVIILLVNGFHYGAIVLIVILISIQCFKCSLLCH